ncbi:hypothetical protein PKB_0586 [Pseudomonas knackmussii B13]|uniref:Peptidase S74 domain-containing protein n=1 Tax=Pseudomonas knackmussii (strain DSM 6978 / CCUG 54928 / LMG 23759 / B13) TaxID=1301098 RepID=A0A024HBU9_PSEKB|nr:tail fiber domain-containing protein [Pseudomonas knackmussii]CDF81963.1 hypothetical protein PKB_0586 [Pseudomonas knackmussii B13]
MAQRRPLYSNGGTPAELPSGDTLAGAEPPITSGTAAQFWRGDKTWQDLGAAVRSAVLTGLSTAPAVSTAVAATDSVLVALGKLQAQLNGKAASGSNADITNLNALATASWGTGGRIYGDFINATHSSRTLLQSSAANSNTVVGTIPTGTASASGLNAYSSSNPDSSTIGQFQQVGAETRISNTVVGSGTPGDIGFYLNGALRAAVSTDGTFRAISTNSTYAGYLRMQNASASQRRAFRVNSGNGLEVLNQAESAITHSFSNNGDVNFLGDTYIQGNSSGGGYALITRVVDGSGNRTAQFRETASGVGIAVGNFPGVSLNLFAPNSDNAVACGWALGRWSAVYAANGTIQTSDQREKTPVRMFSPSELKVAIRLVGEIGFFKWLEAIEKKGEEMARWHCGQTVQFIMSCFEAEGLDPFAYGAVCYDSVDAVPDVLDEQGAVVIPGRRAEDRYSLRYDELNQFILRGVAESMCLMEGRLAALERAASKGA